MLPEFEDCRLFRRPLFCELYASDHMAIWSYGHMMAFPYCMIWYGEYPARVLNRSQPCTYGHMTIRAYDIWPGPYGYMAYSHNFTIV